MFLRIEGKLFHKENFEISLAQSWHVARSKEVTERKYDGDFMMIITFESNFSENFRDSVAWLYHRFFPIFLGKMTSHLRGKPTHDKRLTISYCFQ